MRVARVYDERVGSPAYQDIMRVLNRVNDERSRCGEEGVNYRQVVEAMGLKDPFTGKIKTGVYVPTLERLEMLAEFLGVPPTLFDTYVKRYADTVVRENGLLETFRSMAALNPEQRELLKVAVDRYAADVANRLLPGALVTV